MEALQFRRYYGPQPTPRSSLDFVIAIYDYDSTDWTQLSFKEGTLIQALEPINAGWLEGCIDGKRGRVPGNFVSDLVSVDALSSEIDIILKIGDQSFQNWMRLARDLERQHLAVLKCAKVLNSGGKELKKSRRPSDDGFIVPNRVNLLSFAP